LPQGWPAAFTAAGGTVTDERTGLVWQQQDDGQIRTWETAIAYCEGLSLAGQSDWRLPNVKELESITDDGRYNPSIDPIFTGTKASYYWSSTTYASNVSHAWDVYFYFGDVVGGYVKSSYNYVRCVRGGQ
jgi:hypothetical protein